METSLFHWSDLIPFALWIGLGTLVWRIMYWLLKRKVANKDRRLGFSFLAALVATPVLALVILIAVMSYEGYYPSRDFQKTIWEQSPDTRYELSEDIIDSKLLIGKTSSEVIVLLGTDFVKNTPQEISYHLGYVPDSFWETIGVLNIYFEHQKVVRVSQGFYDPF